MRGEVLRSKTAPSVAELMARQVEALNRPYDALVARRGELECAGQRTGGAGKKAGRAGRKTVGAAIRGPEYTGGTANAARGATEAEGRTAKAARGTARAAGGTGNAWAALEGFHRTGMPNGRLSGSMGPGSRPARSPRADPPNDGSAGRDHQWPLPARSLSGPTSRRPGRCGRFDRPG